MRLFIQRLLTIFVLAFVLLGRIQYIDQLSQVSQAEAQVDPSWDKSSLKFTLDCEDTNCDNIISAQLCNVGSQDMDGTSTYQVYYSASGNPKEGSQVANGIVPALNSGECTTLTYNTQGVQGNYMFRAVQRPGHPGTGELWSTQCVINQCTQPSPTPSVSPSVSPSPSASVSPSVSPDPSVSPTPQSSSSAAPSPTPTPGVGGRSGCFTSLANDHLQCNEKTFDAVMDVFDGTTPKKDILVRFSYNGANREARTNEFGRVKVAFDFNGNGTVVADPDECDTQSMNITMPICPNTPAADPGTTSTERGRGQVLGASTLAETGTADEQIALFVMSMGLALSITAGFGYAYANNRG